LREKYTILLPAPADAAPASGDTTKSEQTSVSSRQGGT
jgi:hypothetical protein